MNNMENIWSGSSWIWAEGQPRKDDRAVFRRAFWLDTLPEKATLLVAAETKYWLWVNGAPVVQEGGLFRESSPGNGYYDQVELTPYLKKGGNLLAFFCWYYGNQGRNNLDCGQAGLRFVCPELALGSGCDTLCLRHPADYPPQGPEPSYLYGGYNTGFDAEQDIGEFFSPSFKDSGFSPALEQDDAPYGVPAPRPIPPLRWGPLCVQGPVEYREGQYRLRLPHAMAFTPYFEVQAQGGEVLDLRSDRYEVPGGPGDSQNRYRGHRLEYRCKKGKNRFDSPYYLFGEELILTSSQPLLGLRLGYRETGYDCDILGEFHCSCPITQRLVEKSARTLVCCMRDNFMDCPDRERGQWIGDLSVQAPQVFFLLSQSAQQLMEKAIGDFLRLRKGDRLVGNVPGANFSELPGQSLNAISGLGLLGQYEKYSGRQDFFQEALFPCAAYLNLWKIDGEGLVQPRKGDWYWFDHLYNQDDPVLENAWYYAALDYCAHMARTLGEQPLLDSLAQRMESVRRGFESRFWQGDGYRSGKMMDDRANALAVLTGLCPKERYETVKQVLTSVQNASIYMENYVLLALGHMGCVEEGYRRMVSRYYNLAMNQNSTLWEDFTILGTKNHAWSGAPATFAFRCLMGIDTTDGFAHVTISPNRALFETMRCRFPGKGGMISVLVDNREGKTEVDNRSQGEVSLLP